MTKFSRLGTKRDALTKSQTLGIRLGTQVSNLCLTSPLCHPTIEGLNIARSKGNPFGQILTEVRLTCGLLEAMLVDDTTQGVVLFGPDELRVLVLETRLKLRPIVVRSKFRGESNDLCVGLVVWRCNTSSVPIDGRLVFRHRSADRITHGRAAGVESCAATPGRPRPERLGSFP